MRRLALLLALAAGCSHEAPGNEPSPKPAQPGLALPPPAPPAPTQAAARIELTSVTLADDCGGTPPWSPPANAKEITAKAEPTTDEEPPKAKGKRDSATFTQAKRRCEQTSMQLAIMAGDAGKMQVKSVELFDEAGKSLGKVTASKPTRWSDANGYQEWDEAVAAGSTINVSYVLSQPAWDHIGDRWNRTFTLKAVVSVGGVDQPAQKNVTLTAPASLPPNVKT